MHYRVNLIGSMSLTEIYVITQIPRLINWLNNKGKYIPNLIKITKGFYLLIIAQCISEFIIKNTFVNAIKGIAVTVMTLFIMLYFIEKLTKDISLIKYIPITSAVSLIVFGDQFGFSETGESTYFKFYIAPLIIYGACTLTLIKMRNISKNIEYILLSCSLFLIIGGARSLGFSLIITLIFYIIYKRSKTINFKKLLPQFILGIAIIQIFLTFIYVPKIKSGEWGSTQNRQQLEMINWNSDLFSILLAARSDFFISAIAFLDKPIWGHGSWAIDKTYKYAEMQTMLFNNEEKINYDIIRYVPNHSVVMGKGTANGIFAFLIFLWIFFNIYKIGFKGLGIKSEYSLYLIWTIISSFQHLMFGPPAILKNNGALAFAIMFAIYYLNYIKAHETKNKIISCNSNI